MPAASDLRAKMRARADKITNRASWYEINNATGTKATIRVYDEIGYWGVTADQFAAELDMISAAEIEVQINSPGGDVFDGIAIYNALRAHPARIVTRVDGIAASAASVIAQAGDHRVMLSAGQMMIHEAWGMAVGPADELRAFADVLDQQNDVIAGIYATRSGKDKDDLRALMAAETWLTDQAAVDAGLADEVIEPAADSDDTKNALTVTVNADTSALMAALDAAGDKLRSLEERMDAAGVARTPAQAEPPEQTTDGAALLAAFDRMEATR